jgi:hypothetical protein
MCSDRTFFGRAGLFVVLTLALLPGCSGADPAPFNAPTQLSPVSATNLESAAAPTVCVDFSGLRVVCNPPATTWYNAQGSECGPCAMGDQCMGVPDRAEPFVGQCTR